MKIYKYMQNNVDEVLWTATHNHIFNPALFTHDNLTKLLLNCEVRIPLYIFMSPFN